MANIKRKDKKLDKLTRSIEDLLNNQILPGIRWDELVQLKKEIRESHLRHTCDSAVQSSCSLNRITASSDKIRA